MLAKYVGEEAELQRLIIKPVTVKEQPCLSFVYRYKTRDITKNFALGLEGVAQVVVDGERQVALARTEIGDAHRLVQLERR